MARYELVERIGAGGMAEIFRGRATAGGGFEKPVAIKRILPHLSQDKRFVELLITEAKTLSQLRHRNVVQIYDVGLGDDGQYFLVMEFVDGVDLGALYVALEKAGMRLPVEVSLHLLGEVCEALDHAHRARGADGQPLGLVHRDVTPSNIMMSRSGEVKLTDFGIAKRMEEATGHGGVRGKFAYISPEQAVNARVDARSDVFAVGVVLYELVVGKRLFSHLPDFDALRAVRDARPLRPGEISGVDPELARILATALAPNPADRYASAGAFGATLRAYRYALASSIGDPAQEIARLVEGHRQGKIEPPGMLQREPTVVRIATAVGFNPGLPRFEDESDAGRAVTGDLFEDEQTRAVAQIDLPRAVRGADRPLLIESSVQRADSSGGLGTIALSEAKTKVVSPFVASVARERESEPRGASLFAEPPPIVRGDPRRRDELARPAADESEDEQLSAMRRRAILLTIGACILCGVAAFVVVGLLFGERAAGAADAGPADAAPAQVDAGRAPAAATAEVPSAPVERKPSAGQAPTERSDRPPRDPPGRAAQTARSETRDKPERTDRAERSERTDRKAKARRPSTRPPTASKPTSKKKERARERDRKRDRERR